MPNPFDDAFAAAFEAAETKPLRNFAPEGEHVALMKDLKVVDDGGVYIEKTFYFPEFNSTETDRIYINPDSAGVVKGFLESINLKIPAKKIAERISEGIGLKLKVKKAIQKKGDKTYYRFYVREVLGRDDSIARPVVPSSVPF